MQPTIDLEHLALPEYRLIGSNSHHRFIARLNGWTPPAWPSLRLLMPETLTIAKRRKDTLHYKLLAFLRAHGPKAWLFLQRQLRDSSNTSGVVKPCRASGRRISRAVGPPYHQRISEHLEDPPTGWARMVHGAYTVLAYHQHTSLLPALTTGSFNDSF